MMLKPDKISKDALLMGLIALTISSLFVCLLGDIVIHGISGLSWSYLTTAPEDAGRSGGIAPILVSTGLILLVTVITATPLSLATAVLLTEFITPKHWLGQLIEHSLHVLASIPSIIFGLFGNAFFCLYLGLGYSILSGGLTLSCMVLPILIHTITEGLRLAPNDYRLAAAALGMTRIATFRYLLLPVTSPALIAGLILGIGRALAETAALVFTSGYVDRMPESLFDSGRSLSIHIYDLSMNIAGGEYPAYRASLVLIILLFIMNSLAMGLIQYWQKKTITQL